MELYTFDSSGGCAICDDMPEEHTEYPTRPHPYCDCIIKNKKSKYCYELGEITTDMSHGFPKDHGSFITYKFFLFYEMEIKCLRLGTVEIAQFNQQDEVDVDKEDYPGDDQILEEMIGEFYYEAAADFIDIAKDVCNC